MTVKLLHLPSAKDIVVNNNPCVFETSVKAKEYLQTHKIFYLKEHGAYIAYTNAAISEIGMAVEELISNTAGYHVQACEIEVVPS